jgi:hypothetical protein
MEDEIFGFCYPELEQALAGGDDLNVAVKRERGRVQVAIVKAPETELGQRAKLELDMPTTLVDRLVSTAAKQRLKSFKPPISEQFLPEHQVTGGSHPSYRHEEPPSPKTEIKLLTGGLLVRIQPEEPTRYPTTTSTDELGAITIRFEPDDSEVVSVAVSKRCRLPYAND